ncbi:MAG: hypothetical protein Q9181_000637 [Wetmoreana brouardii]
MNYNQMYKAYEGSVIASRLLARTSFPDSLTGRGEIRLQDKLGNILKNYFVIDIRRQSVLQDAMDQLWRREKRELLRPLKVRMGMDEGEEGVDHGGVQQEFFRLAIAEAFNPNYGLFAVIDEQTQMTWFHPCSPEPLYKFELLGLLFGLAIYNGLTLPVNFPLAFYRKLQGSSMKTPYGIVDGWPALSKGLQSLLDWSDGDVADVFARTYEFTVEAPGKDLMIDMQRVGRWDAWVPEELDPDANFCACCGATHDTNSTVERSASPVPSIDEAIPPKPGQGSRSDSSDSEKLSESSHASAEDGTGTKPSTPPACPSSPSSFSLTSHANMVTNANREQYVSDYIYWLTEKSIRPQFRAFSYGIFACIHPRSFSLLGPNDLKTLVEGTQDIDVDGLEATTHYDGGYAAEHQTIQDFWSTVRDFSPKQLKSLLEFVTASDRVPVTGWESVQFSVQKNGTGDERLPTSLTCYGRLLLPEYSSRAVLKEKLELAIENSKGFGVP